MLSPNDNSPELSLKLTMASAHYIMALLGKQSIEQALPLYNAIATQIHAAQGNAEQRQPELPAV